MAAAIALITAMIVLLGAIQQIRANRPRGIRIEWSKTLVTGSGVILVAGLGFGAMFAGLKLLNQPGGALIAYLAVVGIGLTALLVYVNHRWPRRGG